MEIGEVIRFIRSKKEIINFFSADYTFRSNFKSLNDALMRAFVFDYLNKFKMEVNSKFILVKYESTFENDFLNYCPFIETVFIYNLNNDNTIFYNKIGDIYFIDKYKNEKNNLIHNRTYLSKEENIKKYENIENIN